MRFILILIAVFIAACGRTPLEPPEKSEDRDLVVLTRIGTVTYSVDENQDPSGFDHDLARLFAEELGVKARFIVAANDADIHRRLQNGEAHMAAAWQIPSEDPDIKSSSAYFQSINVLVTHEASLPISGIEQLAGKTVHVIAGSRQEAALREIGKQIPGLSIVVLRRQSELDLMEGVARRRYEAALVNTAEFNIGSNYYPELQDSLTIGSSRPITWLFAPQTSPELIAQADSFLKRLRENGEMDRLKDRYFGHIDRLTQDDSVRFIERMRDILPQYRPLFQEEQARTGIDWRLLAALAYQESQWNPLATSPTGVRGMMMLTEDTADHLNVNNRLDPVESIRAGAQYLGELRDALPPSVEEPDRTWMAIAAYNLGMGHFNAARHIAKSQNANPDSWYEMKKILPLLAKPQYYSRLKSGRGRGGEAVIMVENIRVFHSILNRHEQPFNPLGRMAGTTKGNKRLPFVRH